MRFSSQLCLTVNRAVWQPILCPTYVPHYEPDWVLRESSLYAAVLTMPGREIDSSYALLVLVWLASYIDHSNAVGFLRGVPLEASDAHNMLQGIRASDYHLSFISQQFQASKRP